MQSISTEMIKSIPPGETLPFALDNSACVMRSRQALHYVKMNLQMPEGVVDYKSHFDRKTNILYVTAVRG